ncbi:MAG: hypothetical protein H0W88_00685 [Parachlamydiaceae bacterium]|nr:hypothetical protein [Parachlamydiaceae bacterium]
MALEDRIEAVKKVSEALSKQPATVEAPSERVAPNKEHFDALMTADQNPTPAGRAQKADASALNVEQTTPKSSLMDEVKKLHTKVNEVAQLTPGNIKNQASTLIAQIEGVKSQLSQAENIKTSYQNILQNRLSHIDDTLKIALSKAGVEYAGAAQANPAVTAGNPLQRFLGYLTQGQYQLEHLQDSIQALSQKNAELSPVNMLVIQMKMGLIQQQLELFTSCLNKALESTKTLMNVQV